MNPIPNETFVPIAFFSNLGGFRETLQLSLVMPAGPKNPTPPLISGEGLARGPGSLEAGETYGAGALLPQARCPAPTPSPPVNLFAASPDLQFLLSARGGHVMREGRDP
jgi:hypothetical protein